MCVIASPLAWKWWHSPRVTYFLNPLARPASGLPPRYLWGGSALLGLSYHLR